MTASTWCAPQVFGWEWPQFPQTDVFLALQRACFLYEQTQTQKHCPPDVRVCISKTCDLLRNMSRTGRSVTMAAEIILILV
jgi:hypothetical protein